MTEHQAKLVTEFARTLRRYAIAQMAMAVLTMAWIIGFVTIAIHHMLTAP